MYGEPAGCCGPVDTIAPISVSINPEARVNVARTATRVPTMSTGQWHPIPLTIVNFGYVTGQLTIQSDPVAGIELELPTHDLTGEPRQEGAFQVRFADPAVVDITLTFRALGSLGGLANHSTLNLLLRAETPVDRGHRQLLTLS
jgi:hypothetical protein